MRHEPRSESAIDAGLAPRVKQLASEYGSARTHMENAMAMLPEVGAELEEFVSEGPSNPAVERLDRGTRELIDLAREAEFRQQFLTTLQHEIEQGELSGDPSEAYQNALESYRAAYTQKTARQKYAQHAAYVDFRSRVWEVRGEGAMPPLIDMIPAEPGDEHDVVQDTDEEIVVGGTLQQFRCPLTATLLEDPVESTVCPHAYSRAAITEYIQSAGRRGAECPATACHALLTLRNLRDAPSLKRRVERYARLLARREEERRGSQWADAAVLD